MRPSLFVTDMNVITMRGKEKADSRIGRTEKGK